MIEPKVIMVHSDWIEFERWLFVDSEGRFSAQVYKYKDDETYVLSDLYVVDSFRQKRLGTFLQEYREEFIRSLGGTCCALYCSKASFMRKWYDRRGYKYWQKFADDKRYVWLKKELK